MEVGCFGKHAGQLCCGADRDQWWTIKPPPFGYHKAGRFGRWPDHLRGRWGGNRPDLTVTSGIHFKPVIGVGVWVLHTSEGKCSTSRENCLTSLPELAIVLEDIKMLILTSSFVFTHLCYLGIFQNRDLLNF